VASWQGIGAAFLWKTDVEAVQNQVTSGSPNILVRASTVSGGGALDVVSGNAFGITFDNQIADAPLLDPISDKRVAEGGRLSVSVTSTSKDPSNKAIYTLDSAPPGATIDPVTGLFSWLPEEGPSSEKVTVRVTGSKSPNVSDLKTFTIRVTTPTSPQTAFVTALYHDVLNRLPDPGGFAGWVQGMQQGVSRQQVAQGFWESEEHRGLQVDGYYARYLHRAAEPAGRAVWIRVFESGMDEAHVQFFFVTSPEYLGAHPSDGSYINGLYYDMLGHSGDAASMAFWETVAPTPSGRQWIAAGFLTSREEYQVQIVDTFYRNFLVRQADVGGEQFWVAILQDGASAGQAAEGFLSSDEYFARATA
jgi:hypothetical protein